MLVSRASSAPPRPSSAPVRSSRRTPRAWAIPPPPSVVPESPPPDEDTLGPRVERRDDKLPHPVRGRPGRVPEIPRDQPQPRRRRHLQDRRARSAPAQYPEVGFYGLPDRAGYRELVHLAAGGVNQGLGKALAAVHHRGLQDIGPRQHPKHPGLDAGSDLLGLEALLETGRCYQDTQSHSALLSERPLPCNPTARHPWRPRVRSSGPPTFM